MHFKLLIQLGKSLVTYGSVAVLFRGLQRNIDVIQKIVCGTK